MDSGGFIKREGRSRDNEVGLGNVLISLRFFGGRLAVGLGYLRRLGSDIVVMLFTFGKQAASKSQMALREFLTESIVSAVTDTGVSVDR